MTRARDKLTGDQRGAIVVMALPIALLLIGMLYYAIGIGDAIIRRETLQDAADASAFSAAVMMARGMNLVVLVNVIMAMLIAVLVMIRIVQIALATGIAICTLLATVTMGSSLAFVPPLKASLVAADRTYEAARRIVKPTVEGLHVTTLVIKYAMPVAMEGRVVHTSRQYAPTAFAGFAIPNQISLPIEPGTESQLCDKAGEHAAQFATLPLAPLLPDIVEEELGDAFGAATGTLASFFCSFEGGNPPAIELPPQTLRQSLPKLPKTKECEDFQVDSMQVDPEYERVCAEARAEVAASTPHPVTGECNSADCSAYQLRTELARTECKPPGRPTFTEYVWQERTVRLRAELHEQRHPYPSLIEHEEPEIGEWRLERGIRPPCGTAGVVSDAWNTDMEQSLCVQTFEPLHPEGKQLVDDPVLETSYREVRHVLSCSRSVPRVTPNLQNTPAGQAGSPLSTCTGQPSRRVHHNLKACAQLGDETFQLRTVLLAGAPDHKSRNVLDAMVLRDKDEAAPWQGLDLGDGIQQASRVFVAQSEYYFDHDGVSEVARDRLEWMWTMDWRARLVRFRLADDESPDGCRAAARSQNRRGSSRGAARGAGRGASRGASRQPSDRCGVSVPSPDVRAACDLAGGKGCDRMQAALDVINALILH